MRLFSFSSPSADVSGGPEQASPVSRKRVLWLSCTAHALHDGSLAILRGIYAGTMATLQLPAGRIAAMFGTRATLVLGTLLAALGYAFAGMSGSLLGLCVALAISGSGSSTQHPLASGAVSRVYGRQARGPLSIYNFSGDLGK
uniref:MFS transporter n=1 Tax=Burkholderia vietnamiensis TaxID=60552 RepID=UPI001591FA0C